MVAKYMVSRHGKIGYFSLGESQRKAAKSARSSPRRSLCTEDAGIKQRFQTCLGGVHPWRASPLHSECLEIVSSEI